MRKYTFSDFQTDYEECVVDSSAPKVDLYLTSYEQTTSEIILEYDYVQKYTFEDVYLNDNNKLIIDLDINDSSLKQRLEKDYRGWITESGSFKVSIDISAVTEYDDHLEIDFKNEDAQVTNFELKVDNIKFEDNKNIFSDKEHELIIQAMKNEHDRYSLQCNYNLLPYELDFNELNFI